MSIFTQRLRVGPIDLATRALLGLCIADFLLMVALDRRVPLSLWGATYGPFGGTPSTRTFLAVGGIWDMWLESEPWRYLSAVFVHLGVDHLLFNITALWSLGRNIEGRFGSARLMLAFVLTGIVGFIASRLYYGPISPPTAGASGALYGLIGIELGVLLSRRDPRARELFFEWLAFAIGFALLFSVNNAAHAGGCVCGAALGALFEGRRVPKMNPRVAQLLAVAAFLASVASIVLCLISVTRG
jgi:membrane associated rhomboid family serine protease